MPFYKIFLLTVLVFIGAPVLTYLVVKFGTAGYLAARRRLSKQTPTQEKKEQ